MSRPAAERSPARILARKLGGELEAGRLGIIAAAPGVGKSALLVHFAVGALLAERPVLHVAVRERVDHVRAHYDEVFRSLSTAGQISDRQNAVITVERNRMIHSYRDRDFEVQQLRANLSMLADVAQFRPQLVVVDGLDLESLLDLLPELSTLARSRQLAIWLTARLSEAEDELPDQIWRFVDRAVQLIPSGRKLTLVPLARDGSSNGLGISLDPSTLLALDQEEDAPMPSVRAPRPGDCTLYSGGANGSEAWFGALAERWGCHEVNFTFDGHKQSRTRGRYQLSPRELAAGDVSLVYVSRRLNRTYSEGSLIRKVLQTLWHMVSRSQQVFVVGQIQEDGTVVGGTGWSVELARMWNKDLWVYDQEKSGWFRWGGHDWLPGVPVIESIHFTGTGTRYLTDDGQAAVEALFERSFRPREAAD